LHQNAKSIHDLNLQISNHPPQAAPPHFDPTANQRAHRIYALPGGGSALCRWDMSRLPRLLALGAILIAAHVALSGAVVVSVTQGGTGNDNLYFNVLNNDGVEYNEAAVSNLFISAFWTANPGIHASYGDSFTSFVSSHSYGLSIESGENLYQGWSVSEAAGGSFAIINNGFSYDPWDDGESVDFDLNTGVASLNLNGVTFTMTLAATPEQKAISYTTADGAFSAFTLDSSSGVWFEGQSGVTTFSASLPVGTELTIYPQGGVVIPEPSTLAALLGLGALAVGLRRRRR